MLCNSLQPGASMLTQLKHFLAGFFWVDDPENKNKKHFKPTRSKRVASWLKSSNLIPIVSVLPAKVMFILNAY
jgi:hypothetical protein